MHCSVRPTRWLRSRGCERMVGPMDFQLNDESGVLIEGFEREPMIKQPWHPPYYQRRCEAAGLSEGDGPADVGALHRRPREGAPDPAGDRRAVPDQARDPHPQDDPPAPAPRPRRVRRRSTTRPGRATGASSRTRKEDLDAYALDLQLVYDRDWFMVAENDTEVVAIAITVPDMNQVLKKMRGRAAAARLVALPQPRARSSTASGSASSACCPSTSTPESPPRSTSSTSTSPAAPTGQAGRWAGSSRPTAR